MQLEPPSQAPNWSPWASCYQAAHLPSETAEDQLQLWDGVGGKLKQAQQREREREARDKREEKTKGGRREGSSGGFTKIVASDTWRAINKTLACCFL